MNKFKTTTRFSSRLRLNPKTAFLFLACFMLIPQLSLAASLEAGLMSKAQSGDPVRVIIRLNTSMPDSGSSVGPEGEAFRSAISNTQQEVLAAISAARANSGQSGANSAVKGVKRFRYHPLLALEADAATLQQLSTDPRVVDVMEDVADPPNLAQTIPLIGADNAFNMGTGYTGNGWAVAILDTGVDKTHNFLAGKVVSEACYSTTGGNSVSVCPGGVQATTAVGSGVNCDVNNPTLSVSACNHGTHVAGIAAGNGASFTGVAKDADIIAIQVFSRFDSASTCSPRPAPCVLSYSSDQIMGLERVLALSNTFNIAAANMSLGGGGSSTPCDTNSRKPAIDNLRAAGIATAISSGNGGSSTTIGSPACISTAISVGSTTKSDSVSSFSNSANFLSLLAPGSSIQSSVPPVNGFSFFSGTSMAAPHVAGTWAIMKQARPAASVTEILTALQTTGVPVLDNRNGLTHPRIQVDEALLSLLPERNDFDSDNDSDVLAIHSSGLLASIIVENTVFQNLGFPAIADPAAGWTVNATGDFNGDKKADLLLYNTTTGEYRIILMDGTTAINDSVVLTLDPALGLEPRGVGDFDGDGEAEIILFDPSSGFTGLAYFTAGVFSSFEAVATVDVANNWTLQDTGHFNGDNKTDLLITNSVTGAGAVLEMDGSVATGPTPIFTLDPALGWTVQDTGDMTDSGSSDIVIVHTSGALGVLQMDELVFQSIYIPGVMLPGWELINVGNYDGDFKQDFLILNTANGDLMAAIQDGAVISSFIPVINLGVGTGWSFLSGKP